jgi:hypothetical protein
MRLVVRWIQAQTELQHHTAAVAKLTRRRQQLQVRPQGASLHPAYSWVAICGINGDLAYVQTLPTSKLPRVLLGSYWRK